MPTLHLYEVPRGAIIEHGGRHWLVLHSGLGPPPHGFYPPFELTLQLLPGGPIRKLSLLVGRDRLEVVPLELRELRFVCRQQDDLLLYNPSTSEMITLPEDRTDVEVSRLEPGSMVTVRFYQDKALWVTGQTESRDKAQAP